jgi:hypothetical protein
MADFTRVVEQTSADRTSRRGSDLNKSASGQIIALHNKLTVSSLTVAPLP